MTDQPVPAGSGSTRAHVRGAARMIARASVVSLVLLGVSSLPGPMPASVREAASARTEGDAEPTRYVRFQAGGTSAYGIVDGESIRELNADPFSKPRLTGRTIPLATARLLSVLDPAKVSKIVGVWADTAHHGAPVDHPRFFARVPTGIVGTGATVESNRESANLAWSGELVLVVGRRARHVSADDAADYIFGVTTGINLGNGGARGGRAPAAADPIETPLGPYLVTGIDYRDLDIGMRRNGEQVGAGNTRDLLVDPAILISHISRYMTLLPGDVIYAGAVATAGDVGAGARPGDVLEVEIEGLGVLRMAVIATKERATPAQQGG